MTTKADHKAALEWARGEYKRPDMFKSETNLSAAYVELRELAKTLISARGSSVDYAFAIKALRAALGEE